MAMNQSRPTARPTTDRPAVDEWGIYDPSQAGLAALFERVEEKRRALTGADAEHVAASMRDAQTFAQPQKPKPETD